MNRIFNSSNRLINIALLSTILIVGTALAINNISPRATTANANLSRTKAELSPLVRPLSANFVCSNVNSIRVESWRDRRYNQAVDKLNPAMIRIPGGDESNYWDWRKGGTIKDLSKLPEGLPSFLSSSKDRLYDSSKLADWQAGLQDKQTPLFVLNMLSDSLESQLEMLKKARDLGMNVKYIELGNEFYFPTENYLSVFPEIEDYTAEANRWISAIKKEFPQAKIAVMGVAKPGNYVIGRVYRWNKEVIKTSLPQADAITIHTYPRNNLVNRDISTDEYPYFEQEDIPYVFSGLFQNWENVSQVIDSFPDNKKIWVTEYNLLEDIHATEGEKQQRVAGSWLHGMYAVLMGLLFLEDSRIDLACNHMLIGSSQFSSILAHKNSFIKPNDKSIKSRPLSLSATGSSLKLFADATEGMNQAQKIKFNNNPVAGKNKSTYSSLYGWVFTNNKKGKKSLVVNLSSRPIEVNISSLFPQGTNYESISGSPRDLVVRPGILNQKTDNAKQKIILPAYSVTKMSNNKK